MKIALNPPWSAVLRLLTESGLPTADLEPAHMEDFLGASDHEDLVGTIGLERHGRLALLRSLASVPARRNAGLGTALVATAERHAAEIGVSALYLLTNTAQQFFARRGYQAMAREAAPETIRGSAEFSRICPASAALMTKSL